MGSVFLTKKSDLKDCTLYGTRIQGVSLVYFQINGILHVFDAKCPHKSCNLARMGKLDEKHNLECTCHDSKFDIHTGSPLTGPSRSNLKKYLVKDNGDILEVVF